MKSPRSSSLPSLLLTAALAASACGGAPPPGAPPAATAPPAALDTAEAVIEASIAAQGGRERMAKLRTGRQTGTLELPVAGLKGRVVALAAAPRLTRTRIEIEGLGTIEQGVTDDLVWELNPLTGSRIVTGSERAQQLRDATFAADLAWKELYPRAELVGVVDEGGAPAYKLVLTAADGAAQTRYIAKDTLLPLGLDAVLETQMGKLPVETRVSDWREIDGIKYPFRASHKEGEQRFTITLERVEANPVLPADAFALPPEIAALAAQAK